MPRKIYKPQQDSLCLERSSSLRTLLVGWLRIVVLLIAEMVSDAELQTDPTAKALIQEIAPTLDFTGDGKGECILSFLVAVAKSL